MLTTSEIGDILYRFCKELSVKDVRREWNFGKGEAVTERVVIAVKTLTHGRTWSKAFAEVNVCVPDLTDGDADLIRLSELEKEYTAAFGRNVGELNGVHFRFGRESSSLLDDSQLRLHYVNIRVQFEYLNFMEQWHSKFQQ